MPTAHPRAALTAPALIRINDARPGRRVAGGNEVRATGSGGGSCAECAHEGHGLLAPCGAADFRALDGVRTPRERRRGEILFRQGEPATEAHCVRDAVVKLTHESPGGRETIVGVVAGGGVVGLASAVAGGSHPCTAAVLAAGTCCVLRASDLRRLLVDTPALARALLCLSIRETDRVVRHMGILTGSRLAPKLATLLLDLTKDASHPAVAGGLSRRDLARLCGVSAEALVRCLARWRSEGIVEAAGRGLRVVDRGRLEALRNRA